MLRRSVCLALVPLVLLSQAMCFGHAHENAAAHGLAGHSPAPHFHTARAGLASSRHHGEHDPAHGPDHEGRTAGQPSSGSHDDDAVYVPSVDAVATRPGLSDGACVAVPSSPIACCWLPTRAPSIPSARPAAVDWSPCPIYLLTLNLRI